MDINLLVEHTRRDSLIIRSLYAPDYERQRFTNVLLDSNFQRLLRNGLSKQFAFDTVYGE